MISVAKEPERFGKQLIRIIVHFGSVYQRSGVLFNAIYWNYREILRTYSSEVTVHAMHLWGCVTACFNAKERRARRKYLRDHRVLRVKKKGGLPMKVRFILQAFDAKQGVSRQIIFEHLLINPAPHFDK